MQYVEAKATATPTTDLGEFTAIVAAWNRDRQGDVIERGAFAKSIAEWQQVGRQVPLHLDHKSDTIVGSVDPMSMRETTAGLEVAGKVDLDTEQGQDVWRQLKRNRIGFSFGYLTVKSRKRDGGGRELLQLDLFEVSVTARPANNATRILSTKSADDDLLPEIRAMMAEVPKRPSVTIASFDA